MKHVAVTSLMLVVITSNAQPSLDAKAAEAWYSGATVEGTTAQGRAFRAYHSPEGKVKAIVDGQFSNDGPWTVRSDGAVCVDWRDWSWGRKPCFWIKEDTDGYWNMERVDDPKNKTRVKRIEGNQYRM